MTISTRDLQPFDVLIANVSFEDRPNISKPRPVIVLNIHDSIATIVAVKVTSHAPRDWMPGEVRLLDWRESGLAKPSVARCSKVLEIQEADVKYVIGHLTTRDRSAVTAGLRDVGGF